MDFAQKAGFGLAAAFLLSLVTGLLLSHPALWQPSLVAFFVCIAVTLRFTRQLSGLQYTAWILTSVAAAMVYPERFLRVGPLDMQNKHLVLLVVQLVMFGMGTRMSLRDFQGVLKMPYPVFVGRGAAVLDHAAHGLCARQDTGAAGGGCGGGGADRVVLQRAGLQRDVLPGGGEPGAVDYADRGWQRCSPRWPRRSGCGCWRASS